MRAFALAVWAISSLAAAQCIPAEYAQYKDKATRPDAVKALADDLCMVQIGLRGALDKDNAMATRRDPAYLKNSDACIAEIRKIMDAARGAGIGQQVTDASKSICPAPPRR